MTTGIQSIPHGWYSVVPTVLTGIGWLLGLFQDGCDFVKVEGDIVAEIASQPNAPYLEAGRVAYREPYYNPQTDSWSVEYIGKCLVYPEDKVEFDVFWNVAKGFDFASMVLGGTCSLFMCFSVCCVFSRGTWRLAGAQVLFASIFQAISFLWFKTELCQTNTCSLFWGSNADIAACCVWMLASILIFCHYPIPRDYLDRLTYDNDTHLNQDGIMTTRPTEVLGGTAEEYQADSAMSQTPQTPCAAFGEEEFSVKDDDWQYANVQSDATPVQQYSGEDSSQGEERNTMPKTTAQIV